jgi:hypothetical protein
MVDGEAMERVRHEIYARFAESGMAPTREELSDALGLGARDVDDIVLALHEARHIVLGPDGGIVMAHPFASIDLHFSVKGRRTLWWGGCAWDSFAIPNLVPGEPRVLVATTCPGCDRALAWTVTNEGPPAGDELAHFLVPVARIWDDVVRTCGHQRIFCSESCINDWLERTGNERGSVFDLATLWRLASHWYDGRLDSPYARREPVAAIAYFAGVGLTGTFWGGEDPIK